MVQILEKPVAWFKADPHQPRKKFDDDGLRRLGESLKMRQNEPVQAQPDGTLIDGERRYRAACLVGLGTLLVIVTEKPLAPQELAVVRLTTFFHRADLTPFEKWQACEELLRINPSWKGKDLADHLKVDPGTVSKILAASKVCAPVREAFAAGKIGPSDVYAISKVDAEAEQVGLLNAKLGGATRDQIERRGRSARSESETVKTTSIKIVLGDAVITVKGADLTLGGVSELLANASKEAEKAKAQGLNAKTAERVWKDRAQKTKAGA